VGTVDSASSFNLIGYDGGLTGIRNGVNRNQVGGAASPIDPMLKNPPADFGGPTRTMALESGSPAIGNGSPAGPDTPLFDQRGFPRPLSGSVDIGAFQTQDGTVVFIQPATATYSPTDAQQVALHATVTEFGRSLPATEGSVTFTIVKSNGTN